MDVEDVGNEVEELALRSELVEVEANDQVQEVQARKEGNHAQASEIFLEFIEVAIHQILYARKLYPEKCFIDRKKYSIPVHISSHPGLNNYIIDALNSLKHVLREDKICHISIMVKDGSEPLENFHFEVNLLGNTVCKEGEYANLEQSLRSFLLNLMSCSSRLKDAPSTASFEIVIGCRDDCEVDLNLSESAENVMWTKIDEADFLPSMNPIGLIPVKALTDSPLLNVQLIVEQIKGHVDMNHAFRQRMK